MHVINGIDVSDPMQNFTAQEWEALGAANSALVMEMCHHANGQQGRNAGSQGQGTGQGHGDEIGG
jgi:hypothetical protein